MARVLLDVVPSMNRSYDLTPDEVQLMRDMFIKEYEHLKKYIEKIGPLKGMKQKEVRHRE